MAGPSKEERKRLRRQMEQSTREADVFSHVVSPLATRENASPDAIVTDGRRLGVNLTCAPVNASAVLGIPGAPTQFGLVLGYGVLELDLVRTVEHYEWLVKDQTQFRLGTPTISYRAKLNLDPAIHFLHLTVTRILGRLTKGILISGGADVVMDDWLCWSNDYMGPDMWSAMQMYDPNSDLPTQIVERFPGIRTAP